MSRKIAKPRVDAAPILVKGTGRRLGAIARRHGGESRSADSSYRLPDPPPAECDGQFDLFDPEQYVPYELRRGRLG